MCALKERDEICRQRIRFAERHGGDMKEWVFRANGEFSVPAKVGD